MWSYTRALLRSRGGYWLALAITVAYGLLSMLSTGMVRADGGAVARVAWVTPPSGDPVILLSGLGWSATLPLESLGITILVAVATGVGLGAAVAVSLRLRAGGASTKIGTTSAATVAALAPAMMALVTLGACCSTVAAAASGLVGGTGSSQLALGPITVPSLFLGIGQLGLLAVALSAQERLFRMFGDLLRLGPGPSTPSKVREREWRRRFIARSPFIAISLGVGVLGSVAFATVVAGAPALGAPGPLILGSILHADARSLFVVGAVLFPALVALAATRRNVGWIGPSLRALMAGIGLSYSPRELSVGDVLAGVGHPQARRRQFVGAVPGLPDPIGEPLLSPSSPALPSPAGPGTLSGPQRQRPKLFLGLNAYDRLRTRFLRARPRPSSPPSLLGGDRRSKARPRLTFDLQHPTPPWGSNRFLNEV